MPNRQRNWWLWVRFSSVMLAFVAIMLGSGNAAIAQDREELFARAVEERSEADVVRIADIPYTDIEGVDPERLSLDVYVREGLADAPVILYVHGGGWRRGSKAQAMFKPAVLAPAGYLFVSMNYRFRPQASLEEMAMDLAAATVWLRDHAAKYGGDPERIFLMGHSAGAHLVSLVGTKGALLERAGGSLTDLRGVISLDTAMYNVALRMEVAGGSQLQAFGEDPAVWRRASPWHYVEAGKGDSAVPRVHLRRAGCRTGAGDPVHDPAARGRRRGVGARDRRPGARADRLHDRHRGRRDDGAGPGIPGAVSVGGGSYV